MNGALNGKVVLVAGASSGLGRATAITAADAGATVVLIARRSEALHEVLSAVEEIGGRGHVAVADATDQQAVSRAVDEAVKRYGRLDVAVNSVGTNIRERSLTELTAEAWQGLLHANLDAAYVLTQAVLPTFREQGDGLLVHVSSSGAKIPDLSGVGYQASKAAVAALAHATMVEERENGVRVTVLFPGLMDTPLVLQRPTPPTAEQLELALQPQDVARMCVAVMSLPPTGYVPELPIYPTQARPTRRTNR